MAKIVKVSRVGSQTSVQVQFDREEQQPYLAAKKYGQTIVNPITGRPAAFQDFMAGRFAAARYRVRGVSREQQDPSILTIIIPGDEVSATKRVEKMLKAAGPAWEKRARGPQPKLARNPFGKAIGEENASR